MTIASRTESTHKTTLNKKNTKFRYWFFFSRGDKKLTIWEKIAIFIYLTLKEWKLLVLVQIPEFVIVFTTIFCDTCFDVEPSAGQYVKIVVLVLQLYLLGLAIGLYPFMRCVSYAKTNSNLNLQSYVTFLVDREISDMLKEFLKTEDPEYLAKLEKELEEKAKALPQTQSLESQLDRKISQGKNVLTSLAANIMGGGNKPASSHSTTIPPTSPTSIASPSLSDSSSAPLLDSKSDTSVAATPTTADPTTPPTTTASVDVAVTSPVGGEVTISLSTDIVTSPVGGGEESARMAVTVNGTNDATVG